MTPIFIVSYYIRWVTTSWTDGIKIMEWKEIKYETENSWPK